MNNANPPKTNDIRRGKTSASNAQADSLCHGRHLAQVGIEQKPSADSQFGDAIHAVLKKLPTIPTLEALHAIPEFSNLDSTQQEIAESCLKIELEKLNEWFGPNLPKVVAWREKRFWWRDQTPGAELEHSGQVDVAYRFGNRAMVVDYKSLAGDKPESAENLQLRDLVCLVAGHLLVGEVGCVIVQPLATHSPIPCVYEAEDIKTATAEMIARVTSSNNPESPRTAGEVQCQFCLAKTKCPEYTKWAGSKVPVPAGLTSMSIQDWTPEQRVIFCENRPIAQEWLDDAWGYMEKGMLKDPNFVPGWFLKPNSPQKPINDLQTLFSRVAALKPEADILPDFMACLKGTKEDIKELIGKLTGLKGKGLTEKAEEMFSGITTEIPKKASLKKKE